jgi:RNA polymerase sigma factor for flagellar operon FliA
MTDEEFYSLRTEYLKTKDVSIRNKIVLAYTDIVKAIAGQFRQMANSATQFEDMISQGLITLIECVDKFDDTKNMKFQSYVYMRTRGAIIDLMRKQDWIPRRVRKNANEINEAFIELSNKLLREPTDKEMAEFMGLDFSEYNRLSGEISNAMTLSFDDFMQNEYNVFEPVDVDPDPENAIQKKEVAEVLVNTIEKLRPQEQQVLSLYYYNGLMFYEIAEIMDLSPQRVGQIHARALIRMRKIIQDY